MELELLDWPEDIAKPNTFLIGSPKCGTTSIASWLSQHSKVFFTSPKEPHYFNYDHGYRGARTVVDYAALFEGAVSGHSIVAEGSVWYLFSKVAIQGILKFQPDSKFIVMVREPISFAISMYSQQRRSFFEDIKEFEQAWALCEERRNGRRAPKAPEPRLLDYASVCSQGSHIEKVLELVGRNRVFVGDIGALKKDARAFMQRLCRFLDLEWEDGIKLVPNNKGYTMKSESFAKTLAFLDQAKRRIGLNFQTGILNWIWGINSKRLEYGLSDSLRREMDAFFKDDWAYVRKVLEEQKGLF